ncbi:Elicitor-responsive protein 3 [Hibiscus syriacus]|uniref:Elicitor-responsive protein 3 n=1 Tax=Hibiscus syriacus TaxID=106335 RepID=A0A6A2ZQ43_HIBSY|nr:Elicitor-responsive protein 3 [Hibiscus syriacus]
MPQGTLQVVLVSAKGLENTDFLFYSISALSGRSGYISMLLAVFRNMDPYVLLTCRTQEQKSSVASGKGSEPEWNENFEFNISEGVSELKVKILDSDTGSQDDFIGEVTIPLEPVFEGGHLPPTAYNVVKDESYCGEIRIGLFHPRGV